MEVVHVNSSPDDLNKLLERVTSFRQACFVWRQIARNDVWKGPGSGEWTEVPAATQIGRRIDLGRLAKIRIATRGKLGRWTSAVATIAVALSVDNIAAESHQCPVFASQVQRDGGYQETNFDSGVGVVIIRASMGRLDRHPRKNNRNERYNDSTNFCTGLYRHLVSPLRALLKNSTIFL